VDLARPYRAVTGGVDAEVLVALLRTNRPMTGREVAARVDSAGHETVRNVLERLVEHGIVERQPAGRAFLHTLNRRHLGAEAVARLSGMRSELWARFRATLAEWEVPAVHASVFGSAIRGDGGLDSDIDLLLVRPATISEEDRRWRDQISGLEDDVRAWTGNHLSLIEQGEAELDQLVASKAPVLKALDADALDLAGTPLRRLLKQPA
jgi:predicted nucleotidyltransferase